MFCLPKTAWPPTSASNICLDGRLSHANLRISRLRRICGRLRKKGKKTGERVFVDNERKSLNNTKVVAMSRDCTCYW